MKEFVFKNIDYFFQDKYVLVVVANDNGNPKLTATATLTIQLEDVNDEVPVFTNSTYTFTMRENRPAGMFVGTFSATDPDLGEGGRVSFFLGPGRYVIKLSRNPSWWCTTKQVLINCQWHR